MLDYLRDKAFPEADVIMNNIDRIEIAYDNVIKLGKVSRKEGLLALDFNVGFVKDTRDLADDLSWMIHLITDGTEPARIEEFEINRFLSNEYKGIDAFVFYLYARGTLYIQEGLSPCEIENFFNSILPSAVHRQKTSGSYFDKEHCKFNEGIRGRLSMIQEEMSDETRRSVEKIKALMQTITEDEWNYLTDRDGVAGWEWIVPSVDEIYRTMIDAHMNMGRFLEYLWNVRMPKGNEIIEACEDFEVKLKKFRSRRKEQDSLKEPEFLCAMISEEESVIRKTLNKVDNSTLALALKGCDIRLRNEVLKYTGKRRKYEIEDDIDFMGVAKQTDVEAALQVLKALYLESLK